MNVVQDNVHMGAAWECSYGTTEAPMGAYCIGLQTGAQKASALAYSADNLGVPWVKVQTGMALTAVTFAPAALPHSPVSAAVASGTATLIAGAGTDGSCDGHCGAVASVAGAGCGAPSSDPAWFPTAG
eukprot:gene16814-16492_t